MDTNYKLLEEYAYLLKVKKEAELAIEKIKEEVDKEIFFLASQQKAITINAEKYLIVSPQLRKSVVPAHKNLFVKLASQEIPPNFLFQILTPRTSLPLDIDLSPELDSLTQQKFPAPYLRSS